MDAIIFNIAGDVPVVTKAWTAGIVVMSVLTSTTIVQPSSTLYNFDLAFKKGQYLRVLYSLFDYGELNHWFLFGVMIMLSQLADVEKTVQKRSQYLWMIFVLSGMIIAMSKWIQPHESLAHVVHKNLLYYKMRIDIQSGAEDRFRGVMSPLMVRLLLDVMALSSANSLCGIMMTYLPAQLYFFFEQIVSKVYGVELCQPPNQWLQRSVQRSTVEGENENENGNEQLQE
ncbi:LAFA_0E10660g1_1 [Lachancea sp. 'fantastica']|nr:LAFA_0E10660g1_1 [Lachancea sp. 'fantastica']